MKTRASKSLVIWSILTALLLALTAFALAGCGSDSNETTGDNTATDATTADDNGDTSDMITVPGSVLTLTAEDNGKSYTVNVGDTITVLLEGNPTTGYEWESEPIITGFATLILLDIEPSYTPAETDSDIAGGGGTFIFGYQAVGAGSGEIELKYWRPFEPENEPLETFNVTLTIE